MYYSNCLKSVYFGIFIVPHFFIFAQESNPEIQVQTQPLQGNGLQRLGNAPIPLPAKNVELMVSPNINIQRPVGSSVTPIPATPKKFPYDSTIMAGRIIYLNGVNITSVRNQELENVNIHIDNNGNIYIEAPQYEVGTEQSFHPLMPSELPKFPKAQIKDSPIPSGVYSKETGKLINQPADNAQPIFSKEFSPSASAQDQTIRSPAAKLQPNGTQDNLSSAPNSQKILPENSQNNFKN
ncbi:MAG: hypothetical protein DCC88_00980 [Spirobacillus cienkowskii]|jgi:hypothetical protein|uniref:Uncharacterized protein n=1 Tax=Spirobacillus cienkowskii TaxID=495820 RepID=A0A369KZR5_9BACT|nr:MAG: hypothetical protein DCC88_00980 [Spirobacillus cienkowskii]